MEARRLELGLVTGLKVETFGEPGQRTFRVLANTTEGHVSLWLEKEQVVMLGNAVGELLERVPSPAGLDPSRAEISAEFIGELEVRSGTLELGYDRTRDGFTLVARELESPLPLDAVALLADRRQIEGIHDEIGTIVAASRPRCVLCGTPLTGEPHFCPPSNGHASLSET